MCRIGACRSVARRLDVARLMTLIATPYTRNGATGAPLSLAGRLAAGETPRGGDLRRAGRGRAGRARDARRPAAGAARRRRAGDRGADRGRARRISRWRRARTATASTSRRGCSTPTARRRPSYLRGAAVSYPLSLLAQALLWRARVGGRAGDAIARLVVAFAGHSQGLLAALLVAEAPGGEVERRAARAASASARRSRDCSCPSAACGRSPMAAIDGITLERLEPLLAEVNAGWAQPGSRGGRRRHDRARQHANRVVVAGSPATLDALRARLSAPGRARRREERRAGRRGGAPLRFEWTPLAVDVPFHSPALAGALERLPARRRTGWAALGAGARGG